MKPAKLTSVAFNEAFDKYWNPLSKELIAKREKEKDLIVKKLAIDQKTKVSEALRKCKILELPACAEDLY